MVVGVVVVLLDVCDGDGYVIAVMCVIVDGV